MSYEQEMFGKTVLKMNPEARDTQHNVKVFSFINGMIVVGWVVGAGEGFVSAVFPMELILILESAEDSIVEYEFVPYLENLTEFDPSKPYEFTFTIASLQSVTVPSPHLVRNYMAQLVYMKRESDIKRGVPDPETMH